MITRRLYGIFFLVAILFCTSLQAQTASDSLANRKVSVNDFKITLLSLGSGSTRITYERAFSPLNSAEFTVGIIGMGWDWMNGTRSNGLLVKIAYKWRLLPFNDQESWLSGIYVKPEFVLAHYDYRPAYGSSTDVHTTFQGALLAEGGCQLVYHWFLFDIYTGVGPSLGTGNDNNYYHSFMHFPVDSHLAFTAGFRLGVAF